jgi:predicted MarR family transcription regulator
MKSSRSAAQKKWLCKIENRDHFKGLAELVRVQNWRDTHPGYWRRRARVGRYVTSGKLAEVVREFALQDMIDTRFSLVVGLVSHLTRTALQDEIASELRRLILLGHGILHQTTGAMAFSAKSDQASR